MNIPWKGQVVQVEKVCSAQSLTIAFEPQKSSYVFSIMKPHKNICKAEIDFQNVERFFAKYSSKCRYSGHIFVIILV